MNNWYHHSIHQEAGVKDWILAALLGFSGLSMDIACAKTVQKLNSEGKPVTLQQVQEVAKTMPKPQSQPSISGLDIEALKSQLIQDETSGKQYPHVYKDSKGFRTIGIGCNLERKDMPQRLAALGVNYNDVLSGKVDLTTQQIQSLFDEDVKNAISQARTLVGNFDQLPSPAQQVVANMVFNMGSNKMSGFNNFLAALHRHDYQEAARQMVNSAWYRQVGNRAKRLVSMMQSVNPTAH